MKRTTLNYFLTTLRPWLAGCSLSAGLTLGATAASFTWDASGGDPLDDGDGAWSATGGTNWFDGSSTYGAWGNTTDDTAVFGVNNGAAGSVTVANVNAGAITFNAAGSGNYTLAGGSITLGGGAILTANSDATIGSVISGSAGLAKEGTAILSLTGTNNYNTGATSVNAGTLRVGNGTAVGSIVSTSAVAIASGATAEWSHSSSGYTLGNAFSGSGTLKLQGTNSLITTQQGLYHLNGNNSGFSGELVINRATTWSITNANNLGSATVRVQDRGTLAVIGGVTASNTVYIENGAGWHHSVGSGAVIGAIRMEGTNTFSGNIILNQSTGITNGDGTGSNSTIGTYGASFDTFSGVISGSGEFSMSRYTGWNGGSTQIVDIDLSGASSNTYTGKTVVDGQGARASMHLLKTGGAVAIQGGTTVQMGSATGGQANLRMGDRTTTGAGRSAWDNQFGTNNGGVVMNVANTSGNWMRFDLLGTNQTLAGITGGSTGTQSGGVIQNEGLFGAGHLSLNPGQNATLTLNGSDDYLYHGIIRDEDDAGTANKLNLVKSGTGTQTLLGSIVHTGTTTINDGTLQIGAGNGSGTLGNNSATTVSSPGTLQFYRSSLSVAIPNAISGNGSMVFLGTGVATQSDYMPTGIGSGFTGTITVDKSRLRADTSGVNFGNTASINVLSGGGLGFGFTSGPTISTPLNLAGAGWLEAGGLFGALRLENGATVSGPVTLTANATVATINSSGGTVSGPVTNGGFDLTLGGQGAGTVTVSGVIDGSGGLVKSGVNKAALTNTNTYTGDTMVSAGTLIVNGSIHADSDLLVNSSGTLGGTGTIHGEAFIDGTLAPGLSTGTLQFGSTVDLGSSSTYTAEINGLADHDKIIAAGALTADGFIKIVLNGFTPESGDTFDIADAPSITGTPALDPSSTALPAGLYWDLDSFTTDGTIKVGGSTDPFIDWADANNVTGGKFGDDDGDGVENLLEFATNSNPDPANGGGASGARIYPHVYQDGADRYLTFTVATRADAVFAADGARQTATKDAVIYTIEASNDLATWNSVVVSELDATDSANVLAALAATLPTLDTGWEWHSFRTDDLIPGDPSDFIRLSVTEAP